MRNEEYFMKIAQAVAMKSKDPKTKVGAVIVDADNRIVSTGYNGMPYKCDEGMLSWERPQKYHYVIHAEMNAVLYARRDLRGCRVYTTHSPCENCLKHMLQAGIRVVVYEDASIVRERYTVEQKEAIHNLTKACRALVLNINGTDYRKDLEEFPYDKAQNNDDSRQAGERKDDTASSDNTASGTSVQGEGA